MKFAGRLAEEAEELPETSTQRVDVGVCPEYVLVFSGSFRDVELEAEAVHEITAISPLCSCSAGLREKKRSNNKCSILSSISSVPVTFTTGTSSARGSKPFAVGTGACGMATGRCRG